MLWEGALDTLFTQRELAMGNTLSVERNGFQRVLENALQMTAISLSTVCCNKLEQQTSTIQFHFQCVIRPSTLEFPAFQTTLPPLTKLDGMI